MAEPALKSREEMSADLTASGFDEGQTRALMQAVTDAVAGLDLLTRSEWERQRKLDRESDQERHQALLDRIVASEKMLLDRIVASEKMLLGRIVASEKMLLGKLADSEKMLLGKLADSEKMNYERHQMLLDRLAASEKMLLGQIAEFKETTRSVFLWMRWGFGIFATLILFIVASLI